MAVHLSAFDFILKAVFFLLELAGFYLLSGVSLKGYQLAPVRWFLLFAAGRDLALLLCLRSHRAYFYGYWLLQMVEIVWLAYIAGYVCRRFSRKMDKSWVTHIPWMFTAYISLRQLPLHKSVAEMRGYENHALIVAAVTLAAGIILTVGSQYVRIGLSLLLLVLAGLAANLLWAGLGYSPKNWEISWVIALGTLLAACVSLDWRFHRPRLALSGLCSRNARKANGCH